MEKILNRHRNSILAAAAAVLVTASPAMAQSWDVLAEEGYAVASVSNGDSSFGVECMETGYPTFMFAPANFVQARRPVDAVIRAGDQTFTWPARAMPDLGRYDIIPENATPLDVDWLMGLLASENRVSVSIPSLNLSVTFSLAGSADALPPVVAVCEGR